MYAAGAGPRSLTTPKVRDWRRTSLAAHIKRSGTVQFPAVSKTILTQCNTIVAFQQFDKTSSDFLLNYMGAEMVASLPALRFRQAIAVGKAFRSGVPLIFEVPEIEEPESKGAEGDS